MYIIVENVYIIVENMYIIVFRTMYLYKRSRRLYYIQGKDKKRKKDTRDFFSRVTWNIKLKKVCTVRIYLQYVFIEHKEKERLLTIFQFLKTKLKKKIKLEINWKKMKCNIILHNKFFVKAFLV